VHWLESLAADATSLHAYLRAIARFPELTVGEERQLAERVQQRDDDALVRLVGSQLRRVLRYVRRYRQLHVPLIDLVHEGNLAVLDAARRYDPDRHGRFGAFAAWWVRQGILHRLSLAPAPPGTSDAESRADQMAVAIGAAMSHGCGPVDDDDAELSADEVRLLDEQWRRTPDPGALEDGLADLDDLGAPGPGEGNEDAVRVALASDLELSLLELEPKERRALALRLGLVDGEPRSLDQIGDRLRVSAARAERLSARALQKLRRQRSVRGPLN
jgi:RNA polymerase primary sigma factor